MSVLYAQPIFAPDEEMLQRNLRSLVSLAEYLRVYPTDIALSFAGYVKDDKHWEDIKNIIAFQFTNVVSLTRIPENQGKAFNVNYAINEGLKHRPDIQHILTVDSDIVFIQSSPKIIDRLYELAFYLNSFKPLGLIGINLKEFNIHSPTVFDNKIYFKNNLGHDETIVHPTEPRGIAGSAWFVSKDAWNTVGGYKIRGVFSGEDGAFLQNVADHGFSWWLAETIYVLHPMETNQPYARWKLHRVLNPEDECLFWS